MKNTRVRPTRPPKVSIASLRKIASKLPPKTVVIAGGDRKEDLAVVQSLQGHVFVKRCILVGDEAAIREAARRLRLVVHPADIVATSSQEETARRTIELIEEGVADVILKGNISTPVLNRAMLKIRVRDTMSLVTMFQSPCIANGRPLLLTDAGVTTFCNFSRMTGMIQNAAEVARLVLGKDRPRIALLSANEKVIESLASTKLAAALSRKYWEDMVVYGPLSFDLATDPESVRIKGVSKGDDPAMKEVAGQADVLVCPSLDAANILYKTLMGMTQHGMAAMAGITVGVKVPYIILSRADGEANKLDSIALCCIYAERCKQQQVVEARQAKVAQKTETRYNVLTVNPGSTSVKVALFANGTCLDIRELDYPHKSRMRGAAFDAEIAKYIRLVEEFMKPHAAVKLDAVVGRGGFLYRGKRRVESGVYQVATVKKGKVVVEKDILRGIHDHAEMDHASNLGIPIAARLAVDYGIPAFTVDPVVADDFDLLAQFSGYAPIARRSTAHVLSVRALAARAAEALGRPLEEISLVVAHMGGGITVAAVRNGKIVDNSIALLGGGPFTPQRAGALPTKELVDLCYGGQFTKEELFVELTKRGGLVSYLNESRVEKIEERLAKGDTQAHLVLKAMAYQIGKEIGAMYVAAGNDVEAIVLSGGVARSELVVGFIKQRIGHLAPILIYTENMEMAAMAAGACKVLSGQIAPKRYSLVL
ncbi:MAG: butyrate kinase [Opitutae bacterium]|nr:butyrate kinase [Opitutae bacterium]